MSLCWKRSAPIYACAAPVSGGNEPCYGCAARIYGCTDGARAVRQHLLPDRGAGQPGGHGGAHVLAIPLRRRLLHAVLAYGGTELAYELDLAVLSQRMVIGDHIGRRHHSLPPRVPPPMILRAH
eukprot:119491-Rhodomonas_salina.1